MRGIVLSGADRGVRTFAERSILLIVLILIAKNWLIEGLPVPCRITGGSMAPTLLGSHHELACSDCGYPFVFEAAGARGWYQTCCPNCGLPIHGLDPLPELDGDRVLIDRTAFQLRPPRRWDVAAFRHPSTGGQLVVKRIVGLPGERVQIRHGDVWIGGQVQRKTLQQQRAMRILVHDAGFRPSVEPELPSRWKGGDPATCWTATPQGFERSESSAEGPIDWLVYHHWRRGWPEGTVVPTPVSDDLSYNEGRPRREEDASAVADVMLSLRIARTTGEGHLWLRATDGREVFEIRIAPHDGSWVLFRQGGGDKTVTSSEPNSGNADVGWGGRSEPHHEFPGNGGARCDRPTLRSVPILSGSSERPLQGSVVEVSLFDGQLLLAIDGVTMAACPLDRPDAALSPPIEPLALGTQGLGVAVEEFRVYRDVYYTRPQDSEVAGRLDRGIELGEAEYFVLGDNSAISEDSRTWASHPTVDARHIVGRPVLVLLPMRGAAWGRKFFQVPALSQIRYIR